MWPILANSGEVCFKNPTPGDWQRRKLLHQELVSQNIFETQDERKNRVEVFLKLKAIFTEWVQKIVITKGVSEEDAKHLGSQIYSFGSDRLNVHLRGADIDALCVAPWAVERNDYFTAFFSLLERQPEVTEIRAVEDAFVPLIKIHFAGIDVDLLFARIALEKIPDQFDLRDDNLLPYMDERCVRSLYGYRVTAAISSLVPNHSSFRLALRTIKLWAKKNGIYSNVLGFFGGLTWTVMVTHICEMYPNAVASRIVRKFFSFYSKWQWSKPIMLTYCAQNMEWVKDPPISPACLKHLMPVIAPAHPPQNSSHNVTESSRKLIVKEIKRGRIIIREIVKGRESWDYLFNSQNFFTKYRHFAVLFVRSETKQDHLNWCGFVESKTRWLIEILERNKLVTLVHINTNRFEPKKQVDNATATAQIYNADAICSTKSIFCSMWFIGLELEIQRSGTLTQRIRSVMEKFRKRVNHAGMEIELLKEGMSVDGDYVPKNQLIQFLDADTLNPRKNYI